MSELIISSGGKESVQNATKLLKEAFRTDPVITYMIAGLGEKRFEYLGEYFHILMTAATMNHAIFHEIGNWQSCGVLMPPGMTVDNPLTIIQAGFISLLWSVGFQGVKRMLLEYQAVMGPIKTKALSGEKKFYYVFFIGTAEESRGKGLCSAIMRGYQDLATRDNIPVCLEATTEKSMLIYKKLGWETVEEVLLGEGKANADGLPCAGGEGVRVWSMIWKPENYK